MDHRVPAAYEDMQDPILKRNVRSRDQDLDYPDQYWYVRSYPIEVEERYLGCNVCHLTNHCGRARRLLTESFRVGFKVGAPESLDTTAREADRANPTE